MERRTAAAAPHQAGRTKWLLYGPYSTRGTLNRPLVGLHFGAAHDRTQRSGIQPGRGRTVVDANTRSVPGQAYAREFHVFGRRLRRAAGFTDVGAASSPERLVRFGGPGVAAPFPATAKVTAEFPGNSPQPSSARVEAPRASRYRTNLEPRYVFPANRPHILSRRYRIQDLDA
jgi:hypothetical protein